ncbi:L-type lectin-domain containing receptor kinase S.6 [Pyrus ussuriensis x Pyrus communis]|uniref:L-type lectin-domain containing receptor kinase S.6 n=1 Tax=Pyrus ussuriensis x Pyrus communis TaxID=2448454 RepID=A0A5N5FZ59_9ROSA|nr:L-type lectin-domain containing receptor kinase S.6 [Pyrus ussuriensis x Pyrus communis]
MAANHISQLLPLVIGSTIHPTEYMSLPEPPSTSKDSFIAVKFDTRFDPMVADLNGYHIGTDVNTVVDAVKIFGFGSDTRQLGLHRLFLLLRLTSPTSSRSSCVSVSLPRMGRALQFTLLTGKTFRSLPTGITSYCCFGAVVLEMATARKPVEDDGTVVVDWVWSMWEKGKLIEAADPRLLGKVDTVEMRMLMTGLASVHLNLVKRPTVKEAARIVKGKKTPPLRPSRNQR